MVLLEDLTAGMRLSGVVADSEVTVVAVEQHGPTSATLIYRTLDGRLGERTVAADDVDGFCEVSKQRWSFDADGAMFRLAAEARRMQQAHLVDPFAAVDASDVEPYPHQIDAVYNRLLTLKPLRFVLADDPGAGKTIMSGLLIRELMLRGDVVRCLIVAPGSLVEQWQDELWDKFGLSFELMSRATVEASRTGNPFLEKNLLIARIDQISRADDLLDRIKASDWDLVIVDEAHKMTAHRYGDELRKTKRFVLGEVLSSRTRHLLLLTATPHNGKNEDFLAFMTLIDPDRFEGRLRGGSNGETPEIPDVSDVMRRLVKENLRTFEGRRLFPRRYAHSLNFELSPPETELYEAVTSYVRTGMGRADLMFEGGDRRRGIIAGFALAALQRRLASSPAAIYHSLRRRRDRIASQAAELRSRAATSEPVSVVDLPRGIRLTDLVDFDFDDYNDAELDELEHVVIDAASVAATAEELDAEVQELNDLVQLADKVRLSGVDTKWIELRGLLRSDHFTATKANNADSNTDGNADDATGGDATGGGSVGKLIVFSEHKDTLAYVAERIAAELGSSEAVVVIHGGVRRHERRAIQDRFRVDPTVRVLVATDAAGEGVNLQVANMMVNYDLPWNPNRIEQRFGRVHRIGQRRPCHLWNLVAHKTREGQVFQRLFEKIEQQKAVYGDQVYDVLGDSQVNTSLRELLIRAVRSDDDPAHAAWMDEVIDNDIGGQLEDVLKERALVSGLVDTAANDEIRKAMQTARARKLQPWFVEAFFSRALRLYGGRIAARERGRFEITRIPVSVRAHADPQLGPVHDRYHRVTFDKAHVRADSTTPSPSRTATQETTRGKAHDCASRSTVPPSRAATQETTPDKAHIRSVGGDDDRAELISPGTPLLAAVVARVLSDHGDTLQRGAVLVDPDDPSTEPRLLLCLEHSITDGRRLHGNRQVVSRRFQYVEIDQHDTVLHPGNEPYLGYAPLTDEQEGLLEGRLNLCWVGPTAEETARGWTTEHLASPHLEEVRAITKNRVDKVRQAVQSRLETEIRYWDQRAEEIKARESADHKPTSNSKQARGRANDLEERLTRRRLELDLENDLHSSPPVIVAAALIVPQGVFGLLCGTPPDPDEIADRMQTDRRAVAAVLEAEKSLGRQPETQSHSNPGFDVLSVDPKTGDYYFIEVKGHLPRTEEISVSTQQVQKAKSNPDCWRLAVVSVPDDPDAAPKVRYIVNPFQDVTLHFAQTKVPLNVANLLTKAGPPQ
ncbi:MAG: helicase-related protein [Acidimicrobiaceae bacterium]|nr:helicase-related protein [Acidimicrobiaceae bacterium]